VKFDLSDDQEMLRSATADFLANESPVEVSRQISECDGEGFSREHWKKLAELGYLGLLAPESAGGQGLGPIALAIVCQQMGRVCFAGPYLDAVVAASVVEAAGVTKLLAEIVAGKAIVTLATADRVWPTDEGETVFRDGHVRGTKYFVPFAASADALLVTTDAGVALVDGPFEARAMETLDEAARFAEIRLDHPAELVGDASLLDAAAALAALGAGADALGICESAMQRAVAYASERQTFGKPIGSYQVLQHRMADMLLRTESSRSTVYRAAWSLENGAPHVSLAVAAANAYAVEAANLIARDCIQIYGGNGFTWEYDVHRFLKRAMTLDQHHGSTTTMIDRALESWSQTAS
jgi:alkylation response protein AidB-like acyl-CoA dehydrogenase